jgi:hypothetical protein
LTNVGSWGKSNNSQQKFYVDGILSKILIIDIVQVYSRWSLDNLCT